MNGDDDSGGWYQNTDSKNFEKRVNKIIDQERAVLDKIAQEAEPISVDRETPDTCYRNDDAPPIRHTGVDTRRSCVSGRAFVLGLYAGVALSQFGGGDDKYMKKHPIRRLNSILRYLWSIVNPLNKRKQRDRTTILSGTDNHVIEVALYQSRELTRIRGRTPETVLANFIVMVLKNAGFDARVHYGFKQTYEPPKENNSINTYNWWNKNSPEHAIHSNLLLYNFRSGGRAWGQNGIAGVSQINSVIEPQTSCKSSVCRAVRTGIHELGHTLHGHHDTPILTDEPKIAFHPNMVELLKDRASNNKMVDWRDMVEDDR